MNENGKQLFFVIVSIIRRVKIAFEADLFVKFT